MTLKEYIDGNDKLLTILGVFAALTVYFSSLEIKLLATILSLTSLTCTLLIWFELWTTFPSKGGEWKIIAFENVLSVGNFALIFYWLYAVDQFYPLALSYVIGFIIMWPLSWGIKKFDLFKRILGYKQGDGKGMRAVFAWVIVGLVFIGSMLLGEHLSPYLSKFLNEMKVESLLPTTEQAFLNHPKNAGAVGKAFSEHVIL